MTETMDPPAPSAPSSAADADDRVGFRSYEVHQRERRGQATPLVRPGEMRRSSYLADPYAVLGLSLIHI